MNKTYVVITLAVLLAAGVFTNFRMKIVGYTRPTEDWLESITPRQVGEWTMVPTRVGDPMVTYRMDDNTYEWLKPFGIVAREFERGGKLFDAVIIAGDNADSFHDQRGCFVGQGWTIKEDKVVEIKTQKHGTTTATFLVVEHPSMGEKKALYFFQGPTGDLYGEFGGMWWDFFKSELMSGQFQKGYFYRFIGLSDGITEQELLDFAGKYYDEAVKTSNGAL